MFAAPNSRLIARLERWLFVALLAVVSLSGCTQRSEAGTSSTTEVGSEQTCPPDTLPAPPSELASARVRELRTTLASAHGRWGAALRAGFISSASDVDWLELRGSLRREVVTLIEAGFGSEGALALRGARVRYLLEVLNAFEASCGLATGQLSTRWNVLGQSDLADLCQLAAEQLREYEALLLARGGLGSDPRVRSRYDEVASWRAALNEEVERRAKHGREPLVEFPPGLTLAEARSKPTVALLEGPGGEDRFLQLLALEIDLRRMSSLGDTSLEALATKLGGDVRGHRRPPPTGPPDAPPLPSQPPRGPRAPPSGTTSFTGLAFDLLDAETPIDKARARAAVDVSGLWLAEQMKWSGITSKAAFVRGLATEDLLELARGWDTRLERLQHPSLSDLAELPDHQAEALEWTLALGDESRARVLSQHDGLRPSGTTLEASRIRGPPRSTTEFEETFWRWRLASRWRLELRAALDAPRDLPAKPIEGALEAAMADETKARLKLFQLARAHALGALNDEIIAGRGPGGLAVVRSARAVLDVIDRWGGVGQEPTPDVPLEVIATLRSTSVAALPESTARTVRSSASDASTLRLEPRRVPAANEALRGFEDLFPHDARWTRDRDSLQRLIEKDIDRAPGGIIFDAELPSEALSGCTGARCDSQTGRLELSFGPETLVVYPQLPAETLRIAWGFVLDGRLVAVDLRPLSQTEVDGLYEQYVPEKPLAKAEQGWIRAAFQQLSSVNLHPALVDTQLGHTLIEVDQLIFEVLPSESYRIRETKRGLSPELRDELFDAFNADTTEVHTLGLSSRIRGYKSIVSMHSCMVERKSAFRVQLALGYAVWAVPKKRLGVEAWRLHRTSEWLYRHDATLQDHSKAMRHVRDVASAIATIRAVIDRGIDNNFRELSEVTVAETATPRFLYPVHARTTITLGHLGQLLSDPSQPRSKK